jgi:hypothetical protein
MPNWCETLVTVEGSFKDLQKLFDTNLSFEKNFPSPQISETEIDDELLAWRLEYWGCKWDIVDEEGKLNKEFGNQYIKFEDNKLVCRIFTPWSPPIGFFRYLSGDMDVSITGISWVSEMNYACKYIIKDVDIVYEKGYDYEEDKIEYATFVKEQFNYTVDFDDFDDNSDNVQPYWTVLLRWYYQAIGTLLRRVVLNSACKIEQISNLIMCKK